jgi:hypothetical protein
MLVLQACMAGVYERRVLLTVHAMVICSTLLHWSGHSYIIESIRVCPQACGL